MYGYHLNILSIELNHEDSLVFKLDRFASLPSVVNLIAVDDANAERMQALNGGLGSSH